MEFNLVSFIILIIGGLTIGLSVQLYKALVVPSEWMFKKRFQIEGMIIITLLAFPVSVVQKQNITLPMLAATLISGTIFGYYLMGFVKIQNFIKLTSKIKTTKPDSESIILTDLANHKEKGINILGQLFINNQKLIFIPIDIEKSTVDIELKDIKQSMILKNRFGIPYGLMVNEHIQFTLSYPKLWIKKINAA